MDALPHVSEYGSTKVGCSLNIYLQISEKVHLIPVLLAQSVQAYTKKY